MSASGKAGICKLDNSFPEHANDYRLCRSRGHAQIDRVRRYQKKG
ncbi:MAG: hypothetical protein PHV59_07635 [Victivallales bacterium]|nr:hypothetical protein [Victivallales bacterium]